MLAGLLLAAFACGESRRTARPVSPPPASAAGEAPTQPAASGTAGAAPGTAGVSSGSAAGSSFGGVPPAAGAGGSAGSSAGTGELGGFGGTSNTQAGSAGVGQGGAAEPEDGGTRGPGSLDLPSAPCEPPIGDWCRRIVGVDIDDQFVIGLDGDGRVLVAGGAVRDSSNTLDVAVLKLEPSGEIIWGRQVGTEDSERTEGMALDASGNVFVVGSSMDSDHLSPFIAKVSSDGEELWFEQPDVQYQAVGVDTDPDGNAVLLVSSGDIFKYAPNGDILWQKRAGHYSGGAAVAVDGNGDIVAALHMPDGVGLAMLSPNGEVLWEKPFDEDEAYPQAMALDPGGDILLVGLVGLEKYLTRHAATGELLWSKQFDRQILSTADNVSLDASGNVFVVGMASNVGDSHYDAYLGKYDPDGNPLWGEALGQRGTPSRRDLVVSPEGAVYVTGAIDSGAFVTRVTPP